MSRIAKKTKGADFIIAPVGQEIWIFERTHCNKGDCGKRKGAPWSALYSSFVATIASACAAGMPPRRCADRLLPCRGELRAPCRLFQSGRSHDEEPCICH